MLESQVIQKKCIGYIVRLEKTDPYLQKNSFKLGGTYRLFKLIPLTNLPRHAKEEQQGGANDKRGQVVD